MIRSLLPRPPADLELYPSALLGLRVWKFDDGSGALRPAHYANYVWSESVTKAECHNIDCAGTPNPIFDDSDLGQCRCGLHAYHDWRCLVEEQPHLTDLELAEGKMIVGIIAGKGHIQVHKHGWRAEEAQVLGLLAPPSVSVAPCPECFGLGEAYCRCKGLGLMARRDSGAKVDRTGEIRVARAAEKYGVRVFDDYEEMMAYGRRLAEPAPEELRVPPPRPFWSRDFYTNTILILWMITALGALIGLAGFTAWLIASFFGPAFQTSAQVISILAIGIAGSTAIAGLTLHYIGAVAKEKTRRLWRQYYRHAL